MKKKKADVGWLFDQIDKVNLLSDIKEEDENAISQRVIRGYDLDMASRADWEKQTEEGIAIAKQIVGEKTFPWAGAANVKYPLIGMAAIQFASRAYPQIVNGQDIVKSEVFGEDPDGKKEARGKRVGQHMSWQLTKQMPEWEPGMDTLLHMLPVVGTCFKKTYFDTVLQRNKSDALSPLDVVVNQSHKGDLTTCRRITHRIFLYKNEVMEREFAGVFREDSSSHMSDHTENDEQELFLEQHCWYDLDGDGYDEPYIATIHYDSGKMCRLVANYDETTIIGYEGKLTRIEAVQYFTKYSFIPSPDGSFYDIGFAHLLGPLNESISTLINQLLDAGALANTGGGFIAKGLRWKGGQLKFSLGEWKPIDATGQTLRDSIFPLPVNQPSSVLFQLLGLLTETGNKLASVSDAMSGEMPSQNTPATTVLAVIEQGLKVFTAIYKRVFRSLASEYQKLYRLNSLYMDEAEYFRVMDTQKAVFKADYAIGDADVAPCADPSVSSEAQRLARAQALLQTLGSNPDPVAHAEIHRQYYEAIGAKNIDLLVNVEKAKQTASQPPTPSPDAIRFQLEVQKAKDENSRAENELGFKHAEMVSKLALIDAQIAESKARTMKLIAEAEAIEPGQQFEQYKLHMGVLQKETENQRRLEAEKLKLESEAGETAETEKAPQATNAPPAPDMGASEGVDLPQPPPVMMGGQQPTEMMGMPGGENGVE